MLLILTNSEDVTADYLVSILNRGGAEFFRFDTDATLNHLSFSYDGCMPLIAYKGTIYNPHDFSAVWYRRPESLKNGLLDSSPEGRFIQEEWSAALEGFLAHIDMDKWMNHPSRNVAASHKIEQLTTASGFGLVVPATLVTQDPDDLRAFYAKHGGQVIVKPLASGHIHRPEGERDSLIYTNPVLPDHLSTLEDLSGCPTFFQEKVDKRCDVRITVVDADLHAVELTACDEDGNQRCDIRRNNMDDVAYRVIDLPDQINGAIRRLLAHYKLRFAAIDMAVTQDGSWIFFEVNPNGQWAWMDLGGCTNIAASFVKSFTGR